MSPRSRRDILRSGVAMAPLLAGCTSPLQSKQRSTETPTRAVEPSLSETSGETTAEPPTTTSGFDPKLLSASASVVASATDEHPSRIRLSLTNESKRKVPVTPAHVGGLPLEVISPFEDKAARLFAFPTNPEHVFISGAEVPTDRVNGCWRFPDGENIGIGYEELDFPVLLDPGGTYTRDHHLFYDGSGGTCVHDGVYQTTTQVKLAEMMETGPMLTLAYELTVGEDRTFSITVEATPSN